MVIDLTTGTATEGSPELCLVLFILCGIVAGILIALAYQEPEHSPTRRKLKRAAAAAIGAALFIGLGI